MGENKQKCIVFLTFSPSGVLQLEGAQMAVAIRSAVYESGVGVDAFLATLDANQESPAWRLIRSSYEDTRILSARDMGALCSRIASLFAQYGSVILEFAGGMKTLKKLIPLKRQYGERLRIVASVWSYRHGTRFQRIVSLIFAFLYLEFVDKVIFGCPYAANNFSLSSLLSRKGKACIMPLAGTSTDEGDAYTAWNILKEKALDVLLKDRHSFKVVYMAQLRPIKNHIWLTKALIPIMQEKRNLHVIYCGGEGGVRFEQIMSLARAANLEDRFHLPGRMPYETVPTILKHADCSIVPSNSETYGFTYIEPMMFGAPVLGTRTGVGEYAIQDYYNGLSFSLSSMDDLRRKLRFLVENRELTAQMGENAKRFARETYTMDRVAAMRMNLYQEIFANI